MRLDLCKEILTWYFSAARLDSSSLLFHSSLYQSFRELQAVEWKRKNDDIDVELSFVKMVA